MKTPSVLAAAVLALSFCSVETALSAPAGATPDPVTVLAEKLRGDPRERATAGAALEKFLLDADSTGRSFVGAGTDHAALGLFARDFAAKADPGDLAILVFASAPGSSAEPRLRAALSAWSGPNQIRQASEKTEATAFFSDAQEQAKKVLDDPRVRADLSISVNDSTAVPVPGGPAALERARLLRERGAGVGAGVFGPDKKAQDLNGGGGAMSALKATDAAHKTGGAGSPGSATLVKNANAATTAPGVQLPRSQGRPDGIAVPAPNGSDAAAGATAGDGTPAPKQAVTPNDGRVVPKEASAWERVKESVTSPLSDAYGFTFEGLEPAPVSFRAHVPAMAYIKKAPAPAFTKVIFYGHGAPGYMTVGEWGGDADEIAHRLKGKMKGSSTVELKGCNTSSIGGASVNPGRGLSALTRRVMYFSIPYLMDRSESAREQLENDWDSDLARDVSLKLRGTKVCGFRTFGLVASRIPVVGTLMGNREATDSNAIGGSKACYVNGVEAK